MLMWLSLLQTTDQSRPATLLVGNFDKEGVVPLQGNDDQLSRGRQKLDKQTRHKTHFAVIT